MTISFRCPQCATRHQVRDEMAGTKARCKCGTTLAIPSSSTPTVPSPAPNAGSPTIPVRCSGCGRQHQAGAALAGKAAKCSCGTVLRIPAPSSADGGVGSIFDELTAEEMNPTPVAQPQAGQFAQPNSSDQVVLAQYAGAGAGRKGNAYSGCPGCGSRDSKKISWTWWGGVLGPRMFNHVRCKHCGAAYNEKTGNYNTTAIAVYLAVSFLAGLVAFGLVVGFFMR